MIPRFEEVYCTEDETLTKLNESWESFVAQNGKTQEYSKKLERAKRIVVEERLFDLRDIQAIEDVIKSYPYKMRTFLIKVLLRSFQFERNQVFQKLDNTKMLIEKGNTAKSLVGVFLSDDEFSQAKLSQAVQRDKRIFERDVDGIGFVITSLESVLSKRKDKDIVLDV